MNRETWAVAAMVVAVVFGFIGVTTGLNGEHGTAVPCILISIVALLLGAMLIKR